MRKSLKIAGTMQNFLQYQEITNNHVCDFKDSFS
jgi:hypothetical protein